MNNMKISDIVLTPKEIERVVNSVSDDKFMSLFEDLTSADDFLARMNSILLRMVTVLYNSARTGLPEDIDKDRIYKISEEIIKPMLDQQDCMLIELLMGGLVALATFSEMSRLALKGIQNYEVEDDGKGIEGNSQSS